MFISAERNIKQSANYKFSIIYYILIVNDDVIAVIDEHD